MKRHYLLKKNNQEEVLTFYVTEINNSKWMLYEFDKFAIISYYYKGYFRPVSSRDLQLFVEDLMTKEW